MTIICATCLVVARAQQAAPKFGGAYSSLDERRQALVKGWVARFVKTTGQPLDPAAFYDHVFSLSAKTTFEAVTHALMTTRLTDASGASLGDALAIVEHVDFVRGEVAGAPGDHQFRMYVRLVPDAVQTLGRSQEFKRHADNSVYHKGYPMNYRAGGVPSVQVSIARDGRRADIDIDYRSSSFPVGLFTHVARGTGRRHAIERRLDVRSGAGAQSESAAHSRRSDVGPGRARIPGALVGSQELRCGVRWAFSQGLRLLRSRTRS